MEKKIETLKAQKKGPVKADPLFLHSFIHPKTQLVRASFRINNSNNNRLL